MGVCGYTWVCAGMHECALVCLGVRGEYARVCAGVDGYAWVCVGMHGCTQVFVGMHRCALVCAWICMDDFR